MASSKQAGPACRQAGQTLMELIVVVTVGIAVVGALTFATIFSIRNAQFAKTEAQATKLAQEGLERVRSARDSNGCINSLVASVSSWNGNNTACSNSGNIWDYQFSGTNNCGSLGDCYFAFDTTTRGDLRDLKWIASNVTTTIPSGVESVGNGFSRAVIISDSASSFSQEKKITVVVTWNDFSGNHQAKVSTYLRRLVR